MYKVYYEVGEQNKPFVKDYKSLKWALRFAIKQRQNSDTNWLDIKNTGTDQSWYHTDVDAPDFKWHNGQSFQLGDLPKYMQSLETL